jgi:hypothetical protein
VNKSNRSIRSLGYIFGLDNNPTNLRVLEELLGNTLCPEGDENEKFLKNSFCYQKKGKEGWSGGFLFLHQGAFLN